MLDRNVLTYFLQYVSRSIPLRLPLPLNKFHSLSITASKVWYVVPQGRSFSRGVQCWHFLSTSLRTDEWIVCGKYCAWHWNVSYLLWTRPTLGATWLPSFRKPYSELVYVTTMRIEGKSMCTVIVSRVLCLLHTSTLAFPHELHAPPSPVISIRHAHIGT